ncbi:hypothetical protein E0H77_05920 [Acinetobacter sp. ANC 4633]|uniref:hypothetical protein n=1 Tax=Acinetobacter sp. ANC 4633 TaxID=2529845 RepID=UPI0010408D41|nr:hypothetical protein [Acinetobacter sp. ANC 4633]TCB27143.1 hypothetical protein E0H77_05920 [Acinetobacter sp. ANC 4633]
MATHQAVYVPATTSGRHHIALQSHYQTASFSHFGGIGLVANAVAMPLLGKAHLRSPFSLQSS